MESIDSLAPQIVSAIEGGGPHAATVARLIHYRAIGPMSDDRWLDAVVKLIESVTDPAAERTLRLSVGAMSESRPRAKEVMQGWADSSNAADRLGAALAMGATNSGWNVVPPPGQVEQLVRLARDVDDAVAMAALITMWRQAYASPEMREAMGDAVVDTLQHRDTGRMGLPDNGVYNLYLGNRDVYLDDLDLLEPRATQESSSSRCPTPPALRAVGPPQIAAPPLRGGPPEAPSEADNEASSASFHPRARGSRSRSARLEVRLPLREARLGGHHEVRRERPPRAHGLLQEAHVRLLRRLPALLQIAGAARDDEVLPRVSAPSGARLHVVDVEVPRGGPLLAVLALKIVSDHEVTPREPNGQAWRALVPHEVQHPGDPERATDDGQGVVRGADRERAPPLEVARLARLVERVRRAAVKEHHAALRGGHLHGREVAVQDEDRLGKDVAHGTHLEEKLRRSEGRGLLAHTKT